MLKNSKNIGKMVEIIGEIKKNWNLRGETKFIFQKYSISNEIHIGYV